MLGDTLAVTHNNVAKTLNRVALNGLGAEYYLDDRAVSGRVFHLNVKHTIPTARGGSGESHMVRLDVDMYDTASPYGYLRRTSAWTAIRTDDNYQVQTEAEKATECLVDLLVDGTITKVVSRQS